jgi:hypothetical protein
VFVCQLDDQSLRRALLGLPDGWIDWIIDVFMAVTQSVPIGVLDCFLTVAVL